jgi:hypothetical protein
MIDDINEEAVDTEAVDTGSEEQATETNETPGLGVNDLRIFKQIIDICTSRGAFKAEEFSSIGEAYEKLASFLAMIDAKAQEEASTDETDETTEDETAETTEDETAETTDEAEA